MSEPSMNYYTSLTIGVFMLMATIPCFVYYAKIILSILRDRRMRKRPAYRLMIAIGIADLTPCIAHAITGLYTTFNKEIPIEIGKLLGVIATPSYVTYTVLTLILALNRLFQAWDTDVSHLLFKKRRVFYWIGWSLSIWFAFVVLLLSPDATISYNLTRYSWRYDESLSLSSMVKKVEMYVEVGSILLSGICYAVVLILFIRKRSVSSAIVGHHLEVRILVQSVLISVYCTVLNLFWHNSDWLPDSVFSDVFLNFMWIFNSWVYPIVYFIVQSSMVLRLVKEATVTRVQSLANTTNGTTSQDGLSLSQIRVKRSPIERTLGSVPTTCQAHRHKQIFIT